jgi:hypothetical protein
VPLALPVPLSVVSTCFTSFWCGRFVPCKCITERGALTKPVEHLPRPKEKEQNEVPIRPALRCSRSTNLRDGFLAKTFCCWSQEAVGYYFARNGLCGNKDDRLSKEMARSTVDDLDSDCVNGFAIEIGRVRGSECRDSVVALVRKIGRWMARRTVRKLASVAGVAGACNSSSLNGFGIRVGATLDEPSQPQLFDLEPRRCNESRPDLNLPLLPHELQAKAADRCCKVPDTMHSSPLTTAAGITARQHFEHPQFFDFPPARF